ncbi:MAG: ABC transporter permease DevC [Oscillatoria sp. PMC 1068.18]|nr:ABC transporter permease DevC [Oscillatoria sp. PMC 1076.18]MEC4987800.1 ABC transporter permease DevC [Oscillatoria sp. PMC 1068.18]
MIFALPLAWLQLKHDYRRTMVALSGIVFAVMMIFMQLGFREALFESAVHLHKSLQGDIFLISPRSTSLTAMESFSERRLDQVLGFEEVKLVIPIYLGFGQWKNPQLKDYWRPIYVIGFEVAEGVFNLPGVQENLAQLKRPNVVLFDESSRTEFGPVVQQFEQKGTVITEIGNRAQGNRQIEVGGLFRLGTSFGADGNLITSDLNFLRIFSQRRKGFIEIGLIQLKPSSNTERVVAKIEEFLPEDVKVLSKENFIKFEQDYWQSSTAIGFVFNLSVGMAIIVGIVVVYQILYTNVTDYLPEYATLKAIGYTQRYLLYLVFQEAIILAILGYIQGIVIASFSYRISRDKTSLPIEMTSARAIIVLVLTILMCFLAGAIAVRKLKDADPADIF